METGLKECIRSQLGNNSKGQWTYCNFETYHGDNFLLYFHFSVPQEYCINLWHPGGFFFSACWFHKKRGPLKMIRKQKIKLLMSLYFIIIIIVTCLDTFYEEFNTWKLSQSTNHYDITTFLDTKLARKSEKPCNAKHPKH